MVDFNLFSWRENQYRYQVKHIKILLCVALGVSALLIATAYYFFLNKIEEVESKLTKKQEILRLHRLSQPTLNQSKPFNAQLYFEHHQNILSLVKQISQWDSERVCLNKLSYSGQVVNLKGHARSALDLTNFMRDWSGLKILPTLRLEQLKQSDDQSVAFLFKAKVSHAA